MPMILGRLGWITAPGAGPEPVTWYDVAGPVPLPSSQSGWGDRSFRVAFTYPEGMFGPGGDRIRFRLRGPSTGATTVTAMYVGARAKGLTTGVVTRIAQVFASGSPGVVLATDAERWTDPVEFPLDPETEDLVFSFATAPLSYLRRTTIGSEPEGVAGWFFAAANVGNLNPGPGDLIPSMVSLVDMVQSNEPYDPAPPEFHPLDLFLPGDLGFFWAGEKGKPNRLFTDLAGTIPATAAGDRVKRVSNSVPGETGPNLLQTDDNANRAPFLRDRGTHYALELDQRAFSSWLSFGANGRLYTNMSLQIIHTLGTQGWAYPFQFGPLNRFAPGTSGQQRMGTYVNGNWRWGLDAPFRDNSIPYVFGWDSRAVAWMDAVNYTDPGQGSGPLILTGSGDSRWSGSGSVSEAAMIFIINRHLTDPEMVQLHEWAMALVGR